MAWRDWVRDVEIEPSIYAADFANLGAQIDALLAAGVRIFHFDVGDGHFVEPVTIGPIVLESIADRIHAGGAFVDCHLMVSEPEKQIPQLAKAGGDSVTFHCEATDDPPRTIAVARELGIGVGIAFKPKTSVEDAVAASEGADFVLCMSIEPGYSGQSFMPEAYERLAELRSLLRDDAFVQVDGGIDKENARAAAEAGAELIVSGTGVFGGRDIAAAYQALRSDVARERSEQV